MNRIAALAFYWHIILNYSTVLYAFKRHHEIGNSCNSESETSPYEWFDQLLDHFTSTDLTLWKQRYGVNASFYKEGGPVFLRIGDESSIDMESEFLWQWMVFGQQFNALCFMLENRFYGESHPTADTRVEYLKYLTVEQVLADIAYFIKGMNQKYKLPENTKWILFGGSYSGAVATWARVKFPYLAYGAVASSAPLLSVVEFYGHLENVKNAIAAHSESCVNEIITANQEIDQFLQDENGRNYIAERFKLCDSIDEYTKSDIPNLHMKLSDKIVTVVQYNNDNDDLNIDVICDMMNPDNKTQAIDRYAALNIFLAEKFHVKCIDYKYTNEVDSLSKTDWNHTKNGYRQWNYQTCTEFGFFTIATKDTDLFGPHFDVNFFIQECIDIFGFRFNETLITNAVERTNILTGATTVNPTNMIFVQHDMDPWHTLGMLPPDDNKNYHVFLLKGTSHCADMYPSSPEDDPQLTDVREKIISIIASWLNVES